MINKKLLFSVRESIPFIKKNVLYQWIGLVCNVLSTNGMFVLDYHKT